VGKNRIHRGGLVVRKKTEPRKVIVKRGSFFGKIIQEEKVGMGPEG